MEVRSRSLKSRLDLESNGVYEMDCEKMLEVGLTGCSSWVEVRENTGDGDERRGFRRGKWPSTGLPNSPMTDIDISEVISKRLHISGLTPAISFDDISQRLGSFGSVTALDGLGKLDALGQPRKFAYATLQTTKPQLSRCALSTLSLSLSHSLFLIVVIGMNALSGSTWKGAKLRIGEAKPDFHER